MTCKQGSGCCDNCGPVLVNASVTGKAKLIKHDGRDILAVPVVAIVEGVLNGALVPNDEFGRYVAAWEGIPVPVSHPQINGEHVSSNLPDVLEARVIGRFHNVTAENGKLKGELWIDVNKANSKGFGDIVKNLQNGETIEVSTAYFADTESKSGVFNGVEYTGIHRNLRPDHLAILPDEVGACSVADGCGTFQNSRKGGFMSKAKEALKTLAAMVGINLEQENMTKSEKVEFLVNSKLFAEGDKQALGLMTDAAVDRLYKHAKDEAKENEGDEEEKDEVYNADDKDMQKNALDAETLTAINWAKSQYNGEKSRLVAKLKANSRCAFSESELKAMHVDTLAKLDGSLSGDYSQRGMPVTNAETTEEPLANVSVIFAKEGK